MAADPKAVQAWVARALGHQCRQPDLFTCALTHRSHGARHNERLEFLGDAVLSFVVARWLYEAYPDADEGQLSRYRAHLVNGEALADIATALGVGDRLSLGGGELKSGGFRRRSILADALEALFGALYLDGGIEAVRGAIERLYAERVGTLESAPELKDAKTRLQEWLQGLGIALPVYTVEEVTGEPHAQHFRVRCVVAARDVVTQGVGPSRRRAEQAAAEQALARLTAAAPAAGKG